MRWRFIAPRVVVGTLVVLNLRFVPLQFLGDWSQTGDWQLWMAAGSRMAAGASPYVATVSSVSDFRWSPLAALLAVPVGLVGVPGWYVLHFLVLGLLRDWRTIVLVAASWPFWVDLRTGNLLTFAFVFAVLALRGSRLGTAAYLGLFLLVPRPVMVPVALWILWRRPRTLIPFALAGLAELVVVAAMGLLVPWITALVGSPGDVTNPINYAPSRIMGLSWCLIAFPLAIVALWRGRLGLASLAASPYVFPYYLLFGFLELPWERERFRDLHPPAVEVREAPTPERRTEKARAPGGDRNTGRVADDSMRDSFFSASGHFHQALPGREVYSRPGLGPSRFPKSPHEVALIEGPNLERTGSAIAAS